MTANFLIIQLIGLCGTVLFFLSFQFKDNKKLFRVQFTSYLVYTIHLLLLGAVTGGISYLINMVRCFCLGSDKNFLKSKKMCVILCSFQIIVLVLTWNGWISILPVAANIASTIGGYTRNGIKIRIAGIFFNSPLWFIYNIIVGSWVGMADELISEASMIISIARFGWKNLENENN